MHLYALFRETSPSGWYTVAGSPAKGGTVVPTKQKKISVSAGIFLFNTGHGAGWLMESMNAIDLQERCMSQTEQLQKTILAIYDPGEEAMAAFLSVWQEASAKRKTILTRAGEVERTLYFITEGIQRVYYYDEQDREATIVFTYAPSFGGVADSFLTQTPSRFFVETLTACTYLKTGFQQLDELMKKYHSLEHLIRLTTNFAFAGVLERMVEIQCYTAEEKFRTLLKRSPHILNMIPHKYIANYLGIDATNFSKLLGKVKI